MTRGALAFEIEGDHFLLDEGVLRMKAVWMPREEQVHVSSLALTQPLANPSIDGNTQPESEADKWSG